MKVLVLGAGVIGATTAYHLAAAGHQVTVLDRQAGAGLETSFANGGQISPCHAEPWANPGVLPKVLKWLGREDAPLLFRWNRWDPDLWAWGLRFLANCTAARAAVNTERTLRVALYSRACLQDLRARLGLDYDQRSLGILHVYRAQADFAQGQRAAALMNRFGLDRQVKSVQDCLTIEPALAPVRDQLAGGIFTPGDESGDAHKFTRAMAEHAARLGAVFRWNQDVAALLRDGRRVRAVRTVQGEEIEADAIVLALGSWSPLLARPAGLRLPIVPAKGYSVTLAADGPAAPVVSVTDDEHKMVYSRLGDRLRAAGTAEMTGHDPSLNQRRWRLIARRAQELFPQAGDFDRVEPWAGLRPVTPDSVPLIGATPLAGLWLNTGHGTLGWTMACGSARLLADLMEGKRPEIDTAGLGLERFRTPL